MGRWSERPVAGDEFADALRAAIAARGLSLDRLRVHLARAGHELSVATLSYWQSGRSRPDRATSRAALESLESILGLRPDELSVLLAAPRRRTGAPDSAPDSASVALEAMMSDGRVVDEAVRSLGMRWNEGLERVSVQELIRVGPDRTYVGHDVREVLRARREGADRWPVWFQDDDPAGVPQVEPLRNCTLGRVVEIPERQVVVAEMLLARPLALGEAVLAEYRYISDGGGTAFTWWERGVTGTLRDVHIEVQFDQRQVPVAAEEFTVVDGVHRAEPLLIRENTIRALRLDFGPGTLGLGWTW